MPRDWSIYILPADNIGNDRFSQFRPKSGLTVNGQSRRYPTPECEFRG
jgi:hypothetical protein